MLEREEKETMPLLAEGGPASVADLPGAQSGRYAHATCPDVREPGPGDGP